MNVSAIIVTRGNVDLLPVLDSLPKEWEVVIWNNGIPEVAWYRREGPSGRLSGTSTAASDLSVYGRYAAIEYASHDLIYVQDDDVIVSDPQAIVGEWSRLALCSPGPDGCEYVEDPCWQCGASIGSIVANMPQEFRHDGYTDSCLVGFGACFHRDAPRRVFGRFMLGRGLDVNEDWFNKTCDVVFTTLTPRVLVDVPKTDLPYATDETRMYRQRDHVGERTRMLELARMVRDA